MPFGNCSKILSSSIKFAHYKGAKRKQASHNSLQAEKRIRPARKCCKFIVQLVGRRKILKKFGS